MKKTLDSEKKVEETTCARGLNW